MSKKILIVIFVLAFLLLLGGIVLSFVSKDDNTDSTSSPMSLEERTKQTSEKAVHSLMDTSMTPQKLKRLYGVDMGSEAILVGKNSILREKSDLEKKLTDYSKAQDYYAKRVEKKVQDTFTYRLGDYLVADEGANVIQKLYFKSYYFLLTYWMFIVNIIISVYCFYENISCFIYVCVHSTAREIIYYSTISNF